MNRHFNKILDILSQQTALYDELRRIGEEKQEAIISNDIEGLEAITKREQGFVKTIMSLENERMQSLDNYCKEKNIVKADTINELMGHFDELERRQFNQSREKLIDVIADLNEVNELNSKLLEQSLDYINLSIGLVSSYGLEDAGYDKKATDKDIKIDKSLFDARV